MKIPGTGVSVDGIVQLGAGIVDLIKAWVPSPEQRAANFARHQQIRAQRDIEQQQKRDEKVFQDELKYLRKHTLTNTYTFVDDRHPDWSEEKKIARMQRLTDEL